MTYIPSATPVANTTDRDPCNLMVPLQLLAAQTSIHPEVSPKPRKIKKEFNEKTRQNVPNEG